MFDFITNFLQTSGYLGVFLLMAAENIFPPIPSEMIMPFAGFIAARGDLHLAGVLAAGTAGTVLGTLPWYYVAKACGEKRLKRMAQRKARWLTVTPDDIDHAIASFEKHGRKAVLFGRLIPAIRTLISVPAGITEMPMSQFLLYSTVGSLVWTAALTGAGYLLESNYKTVAEYIDPVSKIILATIFATWLYRVMTFRSRAE